MEECLFQNCEFTIPGSSCVHLYMHVVNNACIVSIYIDYFFIRRAVEFSKNSFIIVLPTRGQTKMMAIIQKVTKCSTSCDSLICPKLYLGNDVVVIHTSKVIKRQCYAWLPGCAMQHTRYPCDREGGAEVLTKKVHFHHNFDHAFFFKNFFMLSDFC